MLRGVIWEEYKKIVEMVREGGLVRRAIEAVLGSFRSSNEDSLSLYERAFRRRNRKI